MHRPTGQTEQRVMLAVISSAYSGQFGELCNLKSQQSSRGLNDLQAFMYVPSCACRAATAAAAAAV